MKRLFQEVHLIDFTKKNKNTFAGVVFVLLCFLLSRSFIYCFLYSCLKNKTGPPWSCLADAVVEGLRSVEVLRANSATIMENWVTVVVLLSTC